MFASKLKYLPILIVLAFAALASAQDPGAQDSIIYGDINVPIGADSAVFPVYGITDDPVAFFNLPVSFIAPSGGFHFSSVNVISENLTQWDEFYYLPIGNDDFLRLFGIWDTGGEDNLPLQTGGQRVHLFDLVFTIDPGTPDQVVMVNSANDPVGGNWRFGLNDGVTEFIPAFLPGGIIYGTPAGIDDEVNNPNEFALRQNYPNPFNPQTSIEFNLPRDSRAKLSVINILGQKVRTLVDNLLPAGSHTVIWDGLDDKGEDMPSGVYFYTFTADGSFCSRRMLLIR